MEEGEEEEGPVGGGAVEEPAETFGEVSFMAAAEGEG